MTLGPAPDRWDSVPPPGISGIDVLPGPFGRAHVMVRFRESRGYPQRVMMASVGDNGTILNVLVTGEMTAAIPVPLNIVPGLLIDIIRSAAQNAIALLPPLADVIQVANITSGENR